MLTETAMTNDKAEKNVHVLIEGLRKTYKDIVALHGLNLKITRGEFFSLLGPSGCGKTTTLRLLAGLDTAIDGEIYIDGLMVTGNNRHVPPEIRSVGIVFQDYALFPHMTVSENVAFGLHGKAKVEIKKKVEEMISLVGLSGSGKKYPHELSGGQRQRVALARSLAPSPEVMLLDEPFSNLDAELRDSLRNETKDILKASGTTVILVTHDQEEAFMLSDRIGLLNEGKLEQVGTPHQIYHNPSSRFVADFVGKAVFIKSTVQDGLLASPLGNFSLGQQKLEVGSEVELMIRPGDVTISADPNGDAVVRSIKFLGADALYGIACANGIMLQALGLSSHVMPVGSRVSLKIQLPYTVCFPS